jgi:putative serine protease PepD
MTDYETGATRPPWQHGSDQPGPPADSVDRVPDGQPETGSPASAGTEASTTPLGYPAAPDHPAPPGPPYGYQPASPAASGPYPAGPVSAAGPAPGPGRVGRAAVTVVAAVALALGSGVTGGLLVHQLDRDPVSSATGTRSTSTAPIVDRSSLASIAAQVQPSVVDISTGSGEGSGVVLTADGAILTNNHVVDTARGGTVEVTFSDGRSAQAKIVGTDPVGDLAVIKAQGVSGLTAATFGDSDALQVGDTVLALGSPLGLQGTVTAGIVSALHRTIDEGGEQPSPFSQGSARRSIGDAIQTDAAINPGNSGGPLVNTAGQVIGINTAIATSGQAAGNIGVGFAIPSNKAKSAAEQLMRGGKVSHPYLGVSVTNGDGGALIADVTAGSPADKAGLRKGDLITRAGSRAVSNANDLVGAVQAGKAGDELVLTVKRDGSDRQVTVRLAEAS